MKRVDTERPMNRMEPLMTRDRERHEPTTPGLTGSRLGHAAWLGLAALACAGSASPAATATAASEAAAKEEGSAGVGRVPPPDTQPSNGFSATSPWNQPLPVEIPLAPNSKAIVANLLGDR